VAEYGLTAIWTGISRRTRLNLRQHSLLLTRLLRQRVDINAGSLMGQYRRTIVVDADEAVLLQEIATEHGVEARSTKAQGLDPVSVTVVVLIGARFTVSTVMEQFEKWRGGQVIDLRPQAPAMAYRDRQVRHDLILILTADGQVRIHDLPLDSDSGRTLEALTRVLAGIAQPDTKSVAATAREIVGGSASIEVSPTADDR
jgi:hypothetical protein